MQSVRGRSTATNGDAAGSASLYQSRAQQNELHSRCSAEWTLEKTGWVHALFSSLRGIELYCFSLFLPLLAGCTQALEEPWPGHVAQTPAEVCARRSPGRAASYLPRSWGRTGYPRTLVASSSMKYARCGLPRCTATRTEAPCAMSCRLTAADVTCVALRAALWEQLLAAR